jgi:hypothetical protein
MHEWQSISPVGFSVEIGIPWSCLGIEPEPGLTIGFDIGVNDDDGGANGAERDGQLRWNGDGEEWWYPYLCGDIMLKAAFVN